MYTRIICIAALTLTSASFAGASPNPIRESSMVTAAKAFLAVLTPEQEAKAVLPFNSEERLNWFFIPKERIGLTYKAMEPSQRAAGTELLKASLSQKGFQKIETIRLLENVLRVMEAGKGPVRDQEMYYFTIFGEPSQTSTWGWRFEGHHVSVNWTVVNGKAIATTP